MRQKLHERFGVAQAYRPPFPFGFPAPPVKPKGKGVVNYSL